MTLLACASGLLQVNKQKNKTNILNKALIDIIYNIIMFIKTALMDVALASTSRAPASATIWNGLRF